MQEPTFSSLEFRHKKRQMSRERFLERIDVTLRVNCVQLCYNLSDPAMEKLLYEAE